MKLIKKNINSEISQKSLYLILLVLFLRIDLVFLDNTPTGGDMGAHIVAIHTFINDFVPNFQINGWSNDWFAGYPLYYFYFPLPAIVTFFFDLIFPFGVAFKLMVIISTILMTLILLFLLDALASYLNYNYQYKAVYLILTVSFVGILYLLSCYLLGILKLKNYKTN